MSFDKLITKALQRYWRFTRGLTLGAQGLVLTPDNRILLVRHTYRPGWHFPGGGVERNETAPDALIRELKEETGVIVEGEPELFGIYANVSRFPGDHIALFVVRRWHQSSIPAPNSEIAEQRLYMSDDLPSDLHGPARSRIGEVLFGAPRTRTW